MNYLGIDPGTNGGLVILTPTKAICRDMPSTEREVYNLIKTWATVYGAYDITCCIEEIRTVAFGLNRGDAIPKLYGSYMSLRMALVACSVDFEPVGSKVWQKHSDLRPREKGETDNKWKGRLRICAQKLLPGLPVNEKVADALLIADYCRRKNRGELSAEVTVKAKGKGARTSSK